MYRNSSPQSHRPHLIVAMVTVAVVLVLLAVVAVLRWNDTDDTGDGGPGPTDYESTVDAPLAGVEYWQDVSDAKLCDLIDVPRLEKMMASSGKASPGEEESDWPHDAQCVVSLQHETNDAIWTDDADVTVTATRSTMAEAAGDYEASMGEVAGDEVDLEGVGEQSRSWVAFSDPEDVGSPPVAMVTVLARNGNLVLRSQFLLSYPKQKGVSTDAMSLVTADTLNGIFAEAK